MVDPVIRSSSWVPIVEVLNLLSGLKDWVLAFADSDWSSLALALNSFAESVFFPIPPDALLIGIAIRHSDMAIWLALLATISSVAGAVVGYWLGHKVGRPILNRMISPNQTERARRMFNKYGVWAILLAAFTPIPYKVFTILAGMLKLNLRTFIIASLIGRGARFLILGLLLFFYGDQIANFIDEKFALLTLATAGVITGLLILLAVARRRHACKAIG